MNKLLIFILTSILFLTNSFSQDFEYDVDFLLSPMFPMAENTLGMYNGLAYDDFGDLIEYDLNKSLRYWLGDESSEYYHFYPRATGINIFDETTQLWYWADEANYNLFQRGELQGFINSVPIDGPRTGNPSTFYNSNMHFYRRLPDALVSGGLTYSKFLRKKHQNVDYLKDYLKRFEKSKFAKNPFVKVGLKYTKKIVLIQNKTGLYKSSPSHYSPLENKIFINSLDLSEYGFVVLFHELIQSGLENALKEKLISNSLYKKLRNSNKRHYPNINGYIGGKMTSKLSQGKAFSIALTYRAFKKHIDSLGPNETRRAKRYFNDLLDNPVISTVQVDFGENQGTATFSLRLIGSKNGSVLTTSQVKKVLSTFTNTKSGINTDINDAREQIDNRLNKL